MKRAVLIVMDSMGVGALPDAGNYGDQGADTFGHIAEKMDSFSIPNLSRLGLGNISGVADGRFAVSPPEGAYGKARSFP